MGEASRSIKEAADQLKVASRPQPSSSGTTGGSNLFIEDLLKQLQGNKTAAPARLEPVAPAPPPPPRLDTPASAVEALKAILPGFTTAVEKAGPKLTTSIENGVAVIRQIIPEAFKDASKAAPPQSPAETAVQQPTKKEDETQTFTLKLDEAVAAISGSLSAFDAAFQATAASFNDTFTGATTRITEVLAPLVDSASQLNQGLSSTATAVQALANKDWTVRVNVNAANGAATVSTINNLS